MNFFQFAQSSKNKPVANAFASPPPSFIQFPTIAKDETKSEIEKSAENNNTILNSEAHTKSSLDQSSLSPFIFNPKKVTFAKPEATNPTEESTKINPILIPQSQTDISLITSNISSDAQVAKNDEEFNFNDEIKNNDKDITSDNFEEQISLLENDFKSIASWSQKQMSALQQLQEEINISSLKGNELLTNINTILNS